MGTTVSVKRLRKSLEQAKNVGQVEESFLVCGTQITLRSLTATEIAQAVHDFQGQDDIDSLNAFRHAYVCRSIVQINDEDFRGVSFVALDDTDSAKPVKIEIHKFLLDEYVSTWDKSVLDSVYRKYLDVESLAEQKSKEGVTFVVPDESDEDKFRRLVVEVKTLEADIPLDIVDNILAEAGYMRRASKVEIESVNKQLSALKVEEATPPKPSLSDQFQAASPPPAQETSDPILTVPPVTTAPQTVQTKLSSEELQELMRRRTPLNKTLMAPPPELPPAAPLKGKAAEIAALESLDGEVPVSPQVEQNTPTSELSAKLLRRDPVEALKTLDSAPTSGINPRYRRST